MADFAYTTVPGKIKTMLTKIREVGRPPKVTGQWLKTLGFTSSNDAGLLGVLKFIDFTDAGGLPTHRWTQYRGAKHKEVLGEAIRHGYEELFAVYPDANKRSQTDIEHVFSTSTTGGKQVVGKTVSTFKALAEQADFATADQETDLHMASGPLHTAPVQGGPNPGGSPSHGPTIHIDIQVHISPEASGDQIENIFASMAKHLYGPKKVE